MEKKETWLKLNWKKEPPCSLWDSSTPVSVRILWQSEQGFSDDTKTKIIILKHWAARGGCEGKKAPGMHIHKAISEDWERTGRDGNSVGRDGTGRDGRCGGRLERWRAFCRIVGFERNVKTVKSKPKAWRGEPFRDAPRVESFALSRVDRLLRFPLRVKLRDVTVVMIFRTERNFRTPFPAISTPTLDPCSCSFLNIYSFIFYYWFVCNFL